MRIGKLGFNDNTVQTTAGYSTPGAIVYQSDADPYWENVSFCMPMNDLTDMKNNFMTKNGSAAISATQSMFGGYSLYIPSNGSSVSCPASSAFNLGVNNFTIEFWMRLDSLPAASAYQFICSQRTNYNSNESFTFGLYGDAGGTLLILELTDNTTRANVSVPYSTVAWAANTWYHIAVTRSGTALRSFVNGALATSSTVSASWGVGASTATFVLGDLTPTASSTPLKGYLDDFRITKGFARYTAPFTAPTSANPILEATSNIAPLNLATAGGDPYWSDVSLAMDMETLYDKRGRLATLVGSAALSSTQAKFGTNSYYQNGVAGNCATIPYDDGLNLRATTGFTIETWIYINGNSPQDGNTLRHGTIFGMTNSVSQTQLNFWVNGDATTTGLGLQMEYAVSAAYTYTNSTMTISQGAWHHVALCVDLTSTRFFMDGVMYTSTAVTANIPWATGTNTVSIGRAYPDSGVWSRVFNGYIDDFRITRYARYSANFTPPTSANPTFAFAPAATTIPGPTGPTGPSGVSGFEQSFLLMGV